jgi:hypothetical protein
MNKCVINLRLMVGQQEHKISTPYFDNVLIKGINASVPKLSQRYRASSRCMGIYRQFARERGLLLINHSPNRLTLRQEDEAKFKRWLPDSSHPID